MAAATLAFGILPALMILSPAGPHGQRNHILAMIIAVVCVVLAAGWLRGSWPSKRWSIAYVGTLSLCVAVTCLIQSRTTAGMLACVAFAALAGYIALFHTARLLALNALVALTTVILLAVRVAANGDVVLAVCATALVALVNVLVPIAFHAIVHPLAGGIANSDLDPLTGLLNRRAFDRVAGELLSVRGRTDDRYLVIVALTLDNFSLLTGTDGHVAGDRARVAVAQTLRENTRGGAIVAYSGNAEFLIADTFSSTDSTPLVERVRGAVATTPPRLTASMGVVCTPLRALADLPPYDVLDKLIAIADTAMGEARRAGGNQARYIECAAPTLDDRGSDTDDTW
jgi:diguanylate cyclase (GGDEF)-like protein